MTAVVPKRCLISIVNHGHDDWIAALLASIDRYLEVGGYEVRIVLRDNIPPPASPPRLVSRFALERVANAAPCGFGANHNRTFAQWPSDLFLVVNPDLVLVAPCRLDDLGALPDRFLASPMVLGRGAVADFRRHYPTPFALARRWVLAGEAPLRADAPYWFAGVFLVVPSAVFAGLGGFDEGFHMYVEDCDLSWRARRDGVQLVVLDGWRVRHDGQRASRRSVRHFFWHIRSLLRFWRKLAVDRVGW